MTIQSKEMILHVKARLLHKFFNWKTFFDAVYGVNTSYLKISCKLCYFSKSFLCVKKDAESDKKN